MLYIYVEGNSDNRLVQKVLSLRLWNGGYLIKNYAEEEQKLINRTITAQKSQNRVLFISDLDDCPCFPSRIEKTIRKYRGLKDLGDCICVVCKMIESWYVSGLPDERLDTLLKRRPFDYNKVSKTMLKNLVKDRFKDSDYMMTLLKFFDIDTAKSRNDSFRHFCKVVGI